MCNKSRHFWRIIRLHKVVVYILSNFVFFMSEFFVKKIEPDLKSDFHCHTLFSDGTLTPEELVDYALDERRGLELLAITDHDNMNGIVPAAEYVRDNNLPLVIIPGIEISTTWKCGSCSFQIHIVGLSCRSDDVNLKKIMDFHSRIRDSQADLIGNRLIELFSLDPSDIRGMIAKLRERRTFVTRKHFSDFLQSHELVSSNEEAFSKYLGSKGSAFFPVDFSTIEDAVEAVHSAGGVAVLAHPFRYEKMHCSTLRKLADVFKQCGGDGIEAGSPQQKRQEKDFLRGLAQKYDFYCSFGSDFHSPGVPFRSLGSDLWLPDGVRPVWNHEKIAGYFERMESKS